jgi:hypothetical protein
MYTFFAPPVPGAAAFLNSRAWLWHSRTLPDIPFCECHMLSVDLWEFVSKDLVNVFNPGVFQKDGHFEAIQKATK